MSIAGYEKSPHLHRDLFHIDLTEARRRRDPLQKLSAVDTRLATSDGALDHRSGFITSRLWLEPYVRLSRVVLIGPVIGGKRPPCLVTRLRLLLAEVAPAVRSREGRARIDARPYGGFMSLKSRLIASTSVRNTPPVKSHSLHGGFRLDDSSHVTPN